MLPCGCEPCLEGGYGDDGKSTRYSMEWCPLHKYAEQLLEALRAIPDFSHALLCNDNPCRCFVGKRRDALALVTGGDDASVERQTRELQSWQKRYFAGPYVWIVYVDNEPGNLYESEEAADQEVKWRQRDARRGRGTVRLRHIHTLDLAKERWNHA